MLTLAVVLIVIGAVVWALLRPDLGKALVGIGAALLLLAVLLGVLDPGGLEVDG